MDTRQFKLRVEEVREAPGSKLRVRFTNAPPPTKRHRYGPPVGFDDTYIDFSVTCPKSHADEYPVGKKFKLLLLEGAKGKVKKGGTRMEKRMRRNAGEKSY